MRMIAAAGAALTFLLASPAGAASLLTAPGGVSTGNEFITVQSAQAVQRGNVVYPRQGGPRGPVVRGPVGRGPAVVRGPRGNVVVAPGRRGGPYVAGPSRRGNVAGGVAAGVAAGLIGGALLGGLAPAPEPAPVYVAPRRRVVVEEDVEPVYAQPRCMSFRSYDPNTGTFIDRNGIERVCR